MFCLTRIRNYLCANNAQAINDKNEQDPNDQANNIEYIDMLKIGLLFTFMLIAT